MLMILDEFSQLPTWLLLETDKGIAAQNHTANVLSYVHNCQAYQPRKATIMKYIEISDRLSDNISHFTNHFKHHFTSHSVRWWPSSSSQCQVLRRLLHRLEISALVDTGRAWSWGPLATMVTRGLGGTVLTEEPRFNSEPPWTASVSERFIQHLFEVYDNYSLLDHIQPIPWFVHLTIIQMFPRIWNQNKKVILVNEIRGITVKHMTWGLFHWVFLCNFNIASLHHLQGAIHEAVLQAGCRSLWCYLHNWLVDVCSILDGRWFHFWVKLWSTQLISVDVSLWLQLRVKWLYLPRLHETKAENPCDAPRFQADSSKMEPGSIQKNHPEYPNRGVCLPTMSSKHPKKRKCISHFRMPSLARCGPMGFQTAKVSLSENGPSRDFWKVGHVEVNERFMVGAESKWWQWWLCIILIVFDWLCLYIFVPRLDGPTRYRYQQSNLVHSLGRQVRKFGLE